MKAEEHTTKHTSEAIMIHSLLLEIADIAKLRHVSSNEGMFAIIAEQNKKWHAILRRLKKEPSNDFLAYVIGTFRKDIPVLESVLRKYMVK